MAKKSTGGHVHKLKRHTYKNGESVFFCVGGTCNYKVNTGLSLGKESICWRCGKGFNMNEYSLTLAKPHCPDCQRDRHGNKKQTIVIDIPLSVNTKPAEDLVASLRNRMAGPQTNPHLVQDTANDASTLEDDEL